MRWLKDWRLSLGAILFGILLAPEYARLGALIGLVLLAVLWYIEADTRRWRRIAREARKATSAPTGS